MRDVFAALVVAATLVASSYARAAIPDAKLASVAPTRAFIEARAATGIRQREDGAAARLAALEAAIARLEEAAHRDARVRDNVIQAHFDETDRKINEVVGRLQLFVGCLILLFVALFVWVSELARGQRHGKIATVKRPGISVAPRSSRLG